MPSSTTFGYISAKTTQGVVPSGILTCNWEGSALKAESTFHQLSPYIGKLKSSIAGSLIAQFTTKGDLIYDPFAGSGTVALEAWATGRNVIANDLSPYAALLTRAKLYPYRSLEDASKDIERLADKVESLQERIDLRSVPAWVRAFFHRETLRETLAWTYVLRRRRRCSYWHRFSASSITNAQVSYRSQAATRFPTFVSKRFHARGFQISTNTVRSAIG